MASAVDKRDRDDVDDKPNKTVKVTSSEEDDDFEDYSSEGFDAPEDGGSIPGGIRPYEIVDRYCKRLVSRLATICLEFFNWKNVVSMMGTHFRLCKIVKVNVQCVAGAPHVAGLMYYITFRASDRYRFALTFRAKVLKKVNHSVAVKFCEIVKEESGTSQEAATGGVAGHGEI